MSKTKESLLKHFDDYIKNEYFSMVDYDVSNYPRLDKEINIKAMNDRLNKLKEFRDKLKDFLNDK